MDFKIIFTNSCVTAEHLSPVSAFDLPRAMIEVAWKIGSINWATSWRLSDLRGVWPFVLTLVLGLSLCHLGQTSRLRLLLEINLH